MKLSDYFGEEPAAFGFSELTATYIVIFCQRVQRSDDFELVRCGRARPRPRSGRRHRDTVRVTCSIPRPVYEELVRSERASGTYRCKIAARVLSEGLLSDIVDRQVVSQSQPLTNGTD